MIVAAIFISIKATQQWGCPQLKQYDHSPMTEHSGHPKQRAK